MLIFFEATVAFQRKKGMERLRETLQNPSILYTFRENAWRQVWSHEVRPLT